MKSLKLRAAFLLLLLVGSIVLALGFGSVTLPTDTLFAEVSAAFAGETSKNAMILFDIRLPRILFAVLAGATLGLTGLLMQTVSQNYLADPYILGVSAGASTGAVVCIVSGLAQQLFGYGIYIGAFFGAALSTALVIFLTGRSGSPVRLVLMGMGISALFSALTMLAIYGAKDEAQVRSAMFWLMGSLTGIQWKAVPVMAAALAALMLFIWLLRHELDILLLGKEEARHLGMSVMRLQRLIVLFSSAVVAIVVALSGIIGFVGLIIPHAARFFSEPKHGVLLWFTALFGGIVLIWADVLARSAFHPEELPIGILTAGLGAPVFLWIISRKYGGY